jgi:NADH-quinone oxidoreductase subunit G
MMDLAVRQVINRANTQVLVLDCNKSDLARHAQQHLMLAPQQLLAALQQLATGLAQSQSNKKVKRNKKDQGLDQPLNDWLAILQQARQPLLLGVAETQGYAGVSALQQLAEGLGDQAQVAFALPEANSFSCALLTQPGDTEAVLNAIDAGQADTLIVIGADPLGDQLGADRWAKVRDKIKQLIVFDCIATKTVESADCFIPLAAWPERNGMFINYEGRVQAFRQVNRRQQPLPSGLDALLVIAEQLALPTQQPLAELVSEQINDLIEVPQAGGLGNKVKSEAIDHLAAKTTPWVAGDDKQGSEPTEAWQADLHSWYGEDSLARFAPELASLAPAQGVRMCQTLAKEAQLKAGQLIRVMGPEGELTLPLVPVKTMASHTLALSRSALSGLGLYPGDKVQWQAQDNITRVELTAD